MEKPLYKLPQFEGPLDLLLHLISKNKLNIYDIEISLLLKQYLEYIDELKQRDMDIASEFLEMAARLIYIKTVSLLPKYEECEKLKQELTGQLIEYQDCKLMAKILSDNICFDIFSRKPQDIDFDMTYTRNHKLSELVNCYINMIGKNMKKLPIKEQAFSGIVSRRIVSVSSRITYILRKLYKFHEINYYELINSSKERSEKIANFLAILELVKEKRVRITDDKKPINIKLIRFGDINDDKTAASSD